jgi:Fe-S cluster assembly ATPase SufC
VTHPLVTDEMVERACEAAGVGGLMVPHIRDALEAVAADIVAQYLKGTPLTTGDAPMFAEVSAL